MGQEVHKLSLESYEKDITKILSGGTNHDNLFWEFLQAYHQNLKKLAQRFNRIGPFVLKFTDSLLKISNSVT